MPNIEYGDYVKFSFFKATVLEVARTEPQDLSFGKNLSATIARGRR